MQGQIVGKVGFPGTNVKEVVEKFVLTPAQIRTLNSVPIDLVVPANANTFLAPGQCVFVGAQGSGAYSSQPTPTIQYSDGSLVVPLDAGGNWDGSAPAFSVVADVLAASDTDAKDWLAQIGLALQITSGGDVTGGDAPCTIILTYRAYDLTGLL